MYYAKSTNGFYFDSLHGENIPSDAKEISDDLYKSLRGHAITSDSQGLPVAVSPTESDVLGIAKNEIRIIRRDMLDAVTGIGFRASVTGNAELAQEAVQVSQLLLDITDDQALNAAQTYEDMRAAGLAAYRRIADGVSVGLRSAFKEMDA